MIADLDAQITNLSTQIEDRVKLYNLTMEERVRIANRVKATDEAWDNLNIVKDGIFDAIQRGGVPPPSSVTIDSVKVKHEGPDHENQTNHFTWRS